MANASGSAHNAPMLFIPSVTLSALVTLTPATVMVDDVLSVTRTSAAPTELQPADRPGRAHPVCRIAGDCFVQLLRPAVAIAPDLATAGSPRLARR